MSSISKFVPISSAFDEGDIIRAIAYNSSRDRLEAGAYGDDIVGFTTSMRSTDGVAWSFSSGGALTPGAMEDIQASLLYDFRAAVKDILTSVVSYFSSTGATWTSRGKPTGFNGAHTIHPNDDFGLVFIGTFANSTKMLAKSASGNAPWTLLTTPIDGKANQIEQIGYSSPLSNIMCGLSRGVGTLLADALMASTDGGTTWTMVASPFSSGGQIYGCIWSSALGLFLVCGTDTSGNPAFMSSSDGTTWTPHSLASGNVSGKPADANGLIIMPGTDGAVTMWDGSSVTRLLLNASTPFHAVGYSPTADRVVVGGDPNANIGVLSALWVSAPDPATGTATPSGTSAILNGSVIPNKLSSGVVNWNFNWGTTTSYGSTTAGGSGLTGTSPIGVADTITGLTVGVTYHYRLTSSDGILTEHGTDHTFVAGSPAMHPSVKGMFDL